MRCSSPFRVCLPLEIIQLESPEYPVDLETAADGGTTSVLASVWWS